MSVHVIPSPVYPGLQVQVYEPGVLVQVAFTSHVAVPEAHSSMEVHVIPSPAQPLSHTHAKAPPVSTTQVACAPHGVMWQSKGVMVVVVVVAVAAPPVLVPPPAP